MLISHTNI